MAEETIGLKVKVDTGGADASMGSLKKQLKEAQADVQALSDKFGATSKEAINAAKRAGELKDKIGDAKSLVDAFNPDAKFKALTASLSGVAGGFAAVQGGMALLGNESQDVQKALLKVQSAMALSQGLQAVGESIDSFKQLGAVIKNQVSGAFSSLKGAIAATGIGLLVVGVGLLVANFEKVKKVVMDLLPGLSSAADFIGNIVNKITDFVGVTSEANRAVSRLIKDNEKSIKETERFLNLNADKYDEYTQRKIKANLDFKKTQNELIKDESLTEQQRAKYILEAREKANREINKSDLDRQSKASDEAAKAAEKTKAANKLAADEKAKKAAEETARLAKVAEDAKAYQDFEVQRQMDANKWEEKAIEDKKAADEKAAQESKAYTDFEIKLANDLRKVDEDNANAKLKLKQTQAAEYEQLSANLISVLGKDTIAGKAIGIATATINTYQGASEALKQKSTLPSPFDVIAKVANVTAIIATGLKTVKSIASVQMPGGGGGGGSVPSMSTIAPMAPQIPRMQTTNISQGSINDIGNQAIKTYVVESDMTSNQQRIAAIQQRARFS